MSNQSSNSSTNQSTNEEIKNMNTYKVSMCCGSDYANQVESVVVACSEQEAIQEMVPRHGNGYITLVRIYQDVGGEWVEGMTKGTQDDITEIEAEQAYFTEEVAKAKALKVLTNIDAKISAVVAVLYQHGMHQVHCNVVAAALLDNEQYMGKGYTKWYKKMDKGIRSTTIQVGDKAINGLIVPDWEAILERAELIAPFTNKDNDEDGYSTIQPGAFLVKMDDEKFKHYPLPVLGDRVKETKTKTSKLFDDAISALEQTKFTVDEFMFKVAGMVKDETIAATKNHKGEDVFERYVYDGCAKLINDGNVPVVSEFFGDTRGRIYQAACHGPNGQSSDFARSLMSLHDVHTDYRPEQAMHVLNAELADMHSFNDLHRVVSNITSYSGFIVQQLKLGQKSQCKKPWSFIKAIVLRKKLEAHIKSPEQFDAPYIGMAFGLDAKCSGPQLGATLCADEVIMQACGFTQQQVDDAYKIAEVACLNAGFGNIPRAVIKKPYMGIFYGQGYMAFCNYEDKDLKDDLFRELIAIINEGPEDNLDDNARRFHVAIESSFGKMQHLRDAIKKAHSYLDDEGNVVYHTSKATTHLMSDGFVVRMNYKRKVDISGNIVDHQTIFEDTIVISGMLEHKFKRQTFTTKHDHLGDYGRNGFVNFIQATDALLARLIITNLHQQENAQHIIAVHDCFRVNINDMIEGKLHEAIKNAYHELFGNKKNEKRGYLRQGTDLIALYFEGVNQARLIPGHVPSQFDVDGDRHLDDVLGIELEDLIDDMENTLTGEGKAYFFAK